MNYIVAAVLFIVLLFLVISIAKWTVKMALTAVILVLAIFSLMTFVIQPKTRKPFNLNVIEKVLKINGDGSATIIQTTTTTELKQK